MVGHLRGGHYIAAGRAGAVLRTQPRPGETAREGGANAGGAGEKAAVAIGLFFTCSHDVMIPVIVRVRWWGAVIIIVIFTLTE